MELNLSIGKVLLLTFIIISSSYCSNLFSNGLKNALESNRYVQHIILIILIMSLMILFGNPFGTKLSSNHSFNIVIITLLIYAWFILMTKLDLSWFIGVIILLAIYFLYESKATLDINMQLSDNMVSAETKSELIDTFIQTNNYVLMAIFGITVTGCLFYGSEKRVQYGGGFSLKKFWFG
jgi:cellulose synthase/poly-beta-1,6-N-acetylglucosamine synthase-like glycosyltransferase